MTIKSLYLRVKEHIFHNAAVYRYNFTFITMHYHSNLVDIAISEAENNLFI